MNVGVSTLNEKQHDIFVKTAAAFVVAGKKYVVKGVKSVKLFENDEYTAAMFVLYRVS